MPRQARPFGPDFADGSISSSEIIDLLAMPTQHRQVHMVTLAPTKAVAHEQFIAAGLTSSRDPGGLRRIRRQSGGDIDAYLRCGLLDDDGSALVWRHMVDKALVVRVGPDGAARVVARWRYARDGMHLDLTADSAAT